MATGDRACDEGAALAASSVDAGYWLGGAVVRGGLSPVQLSRALAPGCVIFVCRKVRRSLKDEPEVDSLGVVHRLP
jgi:hypothetical protein